MTNSSPLPLDLGTWTERRLREETSLNPRTYKQSHTPTVVQGGGLMEPLPWVFAVFQYFGDILPSVESL